MRERVTYRETLRDPRMVVLLVLIAFTCGAGITNMVNGVPTETAVTAPGPLAGQDPSGDVAQRGAAAGDSAMGRVVQRVIGVEQPHPLHEVTGWIAIAAAIVVVLALLVRFWPRRRPPPWHSPDML